VKWIREGKKTFLKAEQGMSFIYFKKEFTERRLCLHLLSLATPGSVALKMSLPSFSSEYSGMLGYQKMMTQVV